ncbi:uncharacterized protein MONBRDRAFT_11489 [Monosiga brevicollis MX1]|uniref:Helicase ATP-binding domain-containing protein n=1 Tax=Monosiga brevicollis TaxID=81824 RepID=A9V9A9_MONBE|nr:uncharacterized protein MONBRDRAFT_11489 [Monosiga brevicollis MX1]EDQ85899.1 predicted protein [Monosiga brevicollis MX1]|eukprot:XP_001749378.1 hypothetical protein [Monosiga brevicollis MX1]
MVVVVVAAEGVAAAVAVGAAVGDVDAVRARTTAKATGLEAVVGMAAATATDNMMIDLIREAVATAAVTREVLLQVSQKVPVSDQERLVLQPLPTRNRLLRPLPNMLIALAPPCSDVILDGLKAAPPSARKLTDVTSSKGFMDQISGPPPAPQRREDLAQFRQTLPAFAMREQILAAIDSNQVLLLSGETGSGKTTQVPQFVLEAAVERNTPCCIVCSQPRRISAMSVAKRVATEWGSRVGDTVGYNIRLDSQVSAHTKLMFCTTGLLLRIAMSDPDLGHVTHVIVDEVHERDRFSDFLLISLRQLLARRPDVKLIIMSATLHSELFTEALKSIGFRGHQSHRKQQADSAQLRSSLALIEQGMGQAWHAEVGLSTESYLMNIYHELVADGIDVDHRHPQTDLTTLMIAAAKGADEWVDRLLRLDADAGATCRHNGWTAADFAAYFGHHNVLNILQTFLSDDEDGMQSEVIADMTVDERAMVQAYQASFDDSDVDIELIVQLVAHIMQHWPAGEGAILIFLPETAVTIDDVVYVIDSGKLKETVRLLPIPVYGSHCDPPAATVNHQRYRNLAHFQKAELLRVSLDDLCLQDFLELAPEAPDPKAIDSAIDLLQQIAVLDPEENVTNLGYRLSNLSLSPPSARMVLLAYVLGVLDPILTLVCCGDYRSPFALPMQPQARLARLMCPLGVEQAAAKRMHMQWGLEFESDHLALIKVYDEYRRQKTMFGNRNQTQRGVIKAALCAGLYPNIARRNPNAKSYSTRSESRVKVHTGSMLKCTVVDPALVFVFGSSLPQVTAELFRPVVNEDGEWLAEDGSLESACNPEDEDQESSDDDFDVESLLTNLSRRPNQRECHADPWISMFMTGDEYRALHYVRTKWHATQAEGRQLEPESELIGSDHPETEHTPVDAAPSDAVPTDAVPEPSIEASPEEGGASEVEEVIEEILSDDVVQEMAVFYSNRAACQLKLEAHQLCIDDCDEAIKLNPSYAKAYGRRAKALEALERYDQALEGVLFPCSCAG